jgi:hypothetical protein
MAALIILILIVAFLVLAYFVGADSRIDEVARSRRNPV